VQSTNNDTTVKDQKKHVQHGRSPGSPPDRRAPVIYTGTPPPHFVGTVWNVRVRRVVGYRLNNEIRIFPRPTHFFVCIKRWRDNVCRSSWLRGHRQLWEFARCRHDSSIQICLRVTAEASTWHLCPKTHRPSTTPNSDVKPFKIQAR